MLSARIGAPWPPALSWLTTASSVFNLSILSQFYRASFYLALYYSSVVLVLVLTALLVYGLVSFARGPSLLWPLRLLRELGNLAAGPLFIPVLQFLMSPFACDDTGFSRQGFSCAGSGYVAQEIVSIVLALLLIGLALTFTAVFIDSHPLSSSPDAKAHGRVDIILLGVQALLVLMSETFAQRISLWLVLAVLGVAGLVWLASTIFFMPNYSHRINVINAIFATVYLWTFICLLLNNEYEETDAAVTLYVGSPFAVLAGYALANWRAGNIVKRAPNRLANAYEVELYARYKLHAAIWGHPTDKLSADALAATLSSSAAHAFVATGSKEGKDGDGKELLAGAGTGAGTLKRTNGPAAAASSVAEQSEVIAVDGFNATAVAAAAGLGDPNAPGGVSPLTAPAALDEDTLDDLDERAAALRRAVPPRVLAEVTALFRAATTRMRGSALLQLFLARHYAVWCGNSHLQHSALLGAERRKGALDVAFLVYAARRANEDAAGAGGAGGELSALARVAFDKHSADARRYVMLAAARQAAFWAELVQEQADLSRLHRLSSETNAAIASAETAFAELSAINSQAVAIMRLYAAFCLHVTCNNDKAAALTAEADRLEDAKSRDHRNEGNARLAILGESGLDLWAETTAILNLSARSAELGLVLTANAAALKQLGFSRLQLERRSAFTLFPKPLDRWLELALRRYAALGPEVSQVKLRAVSLPFVDA